jgi:hypothetical protein
MLSETQKDNLSGLLYLLQPQDISSLASTVTNYLITPVDYEGIKNMMHMYKVMLHMYITYIHYTLLPVPVKMYKFIGSPPNNRGFNKRKLCTYYIHTYIRAGKMYVYIC